MRRSGVLLAATKKKAKAMSAYKSVTEADIARAVSKGADVRRVWELRNVVTKKYPDLAPMSSADVLKGATFRCACFSFLFFLFFFLQEIRSHRNRHQKVALSWLHLYLSKVDTREGAEADVLAAVMEYQSSGFVLTPQTAGALVRVTERTGSDVALAVLCDPSRYMIWPGKPTLKKLLDHYAAAGDLEAVRLLWKTISNKGFSYDAEFYQKLFRAHLNAAELGDTKHFWTRAIAGLKAGDVDATGASLLVKVLARDTTAPRDEVLPLIEKVKGNASTSTLLELLKTGALIDAVKTPKGGADAATAAKKN